MKKLSERDVQLGELEILKYFASLCEKLGLRYCLMYGTLLGAVRHQGFIPWDDDVDVAMPRPDYEKLLAYLREHEEEIHPLKLMHYKTNPQYIYPISRLCDTRYYVDYEDTTEYGLGLFIDIYPLDGCGSTERKHNALLRKHQFLGDILDIAGRTGFQKSNKSPLITPVKYLLYRYAKLRGARHFAQLLDNSARKNPYETSALVNCTVWGIVKYGVPRSMFEDTILMQFEDAQFRVPRDYDTLLRKHYGDYMQLPPEEKRIGHHNYVAYLKD